MSHLIYPTTNLTATEQLVIERGEGVYVYDNQGKRYLEGMAGLWCTALGYGNEEVIEAQPDQRSLTERYAEESVRFLRDHKEGPFFLYLIVKTRSTSW